MGNNLLRPVARKLRGLGLPTAHLYRLYARARVDLPGPPILANSIPKSGTHLLVRLLELVPRTIRSGHYLTLSHFPGAAGGVDWEAVERALAKVRDGQVAIAHLPAEARLERLLAALGLRTVVMFRDPRDMAVSYVHYILSRPEHWAHRRYTQGMTTFGERLRATIAGFDDDEWGRGMPSLAARLDAYLPWRSSPVAYTCQFEDLIGPRGGGDADRQRHEVAAIAAFLDRPLDEEQAARIAERLWSTSSPTFRSGTIGGWQQHFDDEHRELVREQAAAQLAALGYEPA